VRDELELSDGRTCAIEIDEATCAVSATVDGGPLPPLLPIDMGLVCLGLQAASAHAGQLRAHRAERKTATRVRDHVRRTIEQVVTEQADRERGRR
jgi:nicotinamide mononucleotide (NMN) deamidase PncC